jgi:hypothetical protein
MTVTDFSKRVRDALAGFFVPGIVQFRGSFANGTFDEWSDVDLQGSVERPLDSRFFADLESLLKHAYGPALVRYDPDYRNTTTGQGIRFSFYELPVFWRIDLIVESKSDSGRKYPDPFPDWSVGSSALMNVIWALKYHLRGRRYDADQYLEAACRKIGLKQMEYRTENAVIVLTELASRQDVDFLLLSKTRETIASAA